MFKAHGEYSIQRKGPLLLTNCKGPFNTELVENHNSDITTIIDSMPSVWGQVIVIHQDSLWTPDAERRMCQTVSVRKSRGLRVSAVVLENPNSKVILKNQISRVYDFAEVEHGFFEDTFSAELWALAKIKPKNTTP